MLTLLAPANIKAQFFLPQPQLGAINQPVRLQCHGWGAPIPANIDSSRAAKDTSPIICRTKNRAKRVFMVEARSKPAGRAPPAFW